MTLTKCSRICFNHKWNLNITYCLSTSSVNMCFTFHIRVISTKLEIEKKNYTTHILIDISNRNKVGQLKYRALATFAA